jgi:hypothetical protein
MFSSVKAMKANNAFPRVRPRPRPSYFQRAKVVSVRVLKIFRFEDGPDA